MTTARHTSLTTMHPKTIIRGHRVIKVWEYDLEKDQIIPGTDKVVVNGGVDLSKKPIWIEAPHLYKKRWKILPDVCRREVPEAGTVK